MSYSFTDDNEEDPLSQTMMVPFADLLNHHTEHNAELSYHSNYLQLVAVKDIVKVPLVVILNKQPFNQIIIIIAGTGSDEYFWSATKLLTTAYIWICITRQQP